MVDIEEALAGAGTGRFQYRLLGIFGLVWAADAMQVLAVGFTAASLAGGFGMSVPAVLQSGTVFFLGMLVGAALFGRLADRIGRRRVLLLTVALDAVVGLASAFSPSFAVFAACRFVVGLAVGGILPVDYALMAEFLPAKSRGRWLVALEGFWAVGTVAIALIAWGLKVGEVADLWRWVVGLIALPAFAGFALRLGIPESPRFLLQQGRVAEAELIVNRVRIANGAAPLANGTLSPELRSDIAARGASASLLSPALRQRTLAIMAVWFLVSVAYYGVFLWIPAKLAGQGFGFVRGYDFLVLLAIVQLPGYALAAYGVERWGRKATLAGFALLSAIGCFLFTLAASPGLIGFSLCLMSFALLGTWGALYAFTPELYPTASRATGMGMAGAMARLGGLLAPSAVALVVTDSMTLAVGIFAGLLVLAALATLAVGVETRKAAVG